VRALLQEFMSDCVSQLEGVKKAGFAKNVSPAVEKVLGHKGRTFETFLTEQKHKLE
jgi:hypothetical protein